MCVLNGIDTLIPDSAIRLKGRKVCVLCNQASIANDGRPTLDLLLSWQSVSGFEVVAVFGPQHGIWGHTQDNMIEWEGYRDARTGLPFYSLYGEVRMPRPEWLRGSDTLVVDLVDVGSRYYTFLWSMVHCMEACERAGVEMVVLDRVNPINGVDVEGTVLDPSFASFVGLHPLPMRHGKTIGELAGHFQQTLHPNLALKVVEVQDWDRPSFFDETGLLWAMPSPNMPTPDTALVYPGGCLIEGTQMSEGRGTTRPFEIVGAPYVDGWKLAKELEGDGLPGVFFRPIQFQPTFQKHAGHVCGGLFVHVTDRRVFRPVLTYLALIRQVIRLWPEDFRWLDPPYEYETEKMPIDILFGNGWLRPMLETGAPLGEIKEKLDKESGQWPAAWPASSGK